jgi:hypothetical protein
MKDSKGKGNGGEIITSRRGRGLKTGCLVEIVRWGLKLRVRCIVKFTQIFRPEDELPTSTPNSTPNSTANTRSPSSPQLVNTYISK